MNQKLIPFRNVFWLGFFACILLAWWVLFDMSLSMGLDLIGRPGMMAEKIRVWTRVWECRCRWRGLPRDLECGRS